MDNLTVVIPFYNGHRHIGQLLENLPPDLKVIIVDDRSDEPYQSNLPNVHIFRLEEKGYFAGAVNFGLKACQTDVLVLNQDTELTGTIWLDLLAEKRGEYAMLGERITGNHPAWPTGYIHGTFMFLRRDAIQTVGLLNGVDYPLWGNTCEWQLRAARAGFNILPLEKVPGFTHHRQGGTGDSITLLLRDEPEKKGLMIRTPPEISVVVTCYNYGRYLPDLVNSLIGGETSLGTFPQQSFASFEVIIVDDASTDDSWEMCQAVSDPWKGVKAIRLAGNVGTAAANNAGIRRAHGKYIAIMNADDMMEPGRLERLYRAQLQHPHNFVYDRIMAFRDGKRRPEQQFRVSPYDFEKLIYRNHVHAGIMFPKQAWQDIGGYPEAFNDGREDWAVNIALGVRGWCGVYLNEPGYLYRRERQNRTLANTSPKHHETFLYRLIRTFPEIYAGERPKMCCGNGPKPNGGAPAMSNSVRQALAVPGGAGTVLLEYVGGSHGTQSFYGIVTGARYEAGLTKPYIPVDVRDAETRLASKPGLLEIRDDGKIVFRRYVSPEEAADPDEDDFSPSPELVGETESVSLSAVNELPDVNALTAKEILALAGYTQEVWQVLLDDEQAGKGRKTVLAFLEGKING